MISSVQKRVAIAATAMILSVGLLVGCGSDKKMDGNNDKKSYKVGIVQLVEHPALDAANKGFVEGLASQGFKVGENLEIDKQNAQGDQSNLNTIAQRFVTNKVDLIGAIATPAAQTVANATKTIPVVGMAITDYKAAKLVSSNEKPGGNITGTSDNIPTEQQVDLMLEIMPTLKVVGVIYSSSEVNSQVQVAAFKKYAESKGLKVVESTVSNVNDISQVATNLVGSGVQAIYVPTDNVLASAMPSLLKVTNEAKIPVFPSEEAMIKAGGIAMYSVDYYKLGYQAGIMAAHILKGEKPADMPIETQKDLKLVVNKEAAAAMGITIPESILSKVAK